MVQCKLLGINRSSLYYTPVADSALNLELMRRIDEQYLKYPWGQQKMYDWLRLQGYPINIKRVIRLYKKLNIKGIAPKPNTSKPHLGHEIYPYLIRGWRPIEPNQLWSGDITYIPVRGGFLYLFAIIDWFSRYVVSWRLSNTMDVNFCIEALSEALSKDTPCIWNSDQGSQFTATAFTNILKNSQIAISMDGIGRATDNAFIERLWRSVKYEEIYPKDYCDGRDTYRGLAEYFPHYNVERPHQALKGIPPIRVHENHQVYSEGIPESDLKPLIIDQEWVCDRFQGHPIIGRKFKGKIL